MKRVMKRALTRADSLARRHPLLAFAVAGALLVAGRAVFTVDEADLTTLVVQVDSSATQADVQTLTNEALLISFAMRSGFVHNDPAVRDRLVRNVKFVDDTLTETEALNEAIRLDMHRSDAVTRGRLIWLASEALATATRSTAAPSDEALLAYLTEHESRFRRPPALSFEQIFVSRQRHGDDLAARAGQVRALAAELASEARGAGLSDPGLLPASMSRASPTRIDARFGAGFSSRLLALADAATDGNGRDDADSDSNHGWSAPIPSAFGVHLVRITDRSPAGIPAFEAIRERVRHEYLADTRDDRVRDALSRLRAGYRIKLEKRT